MPAKFSERVKGSQPEKTNCQHAENDQAGDQRPLFVWGHANPAIQVRMFRS